ncbi:hypothetical protein W97_08805 [Coniosporium apollinis CBS 100218]|uniref:Uncharacterized protein n=1 Tax=Coniosporium apollinis (strain CBS 100218) TaxID=1168221 RepID=R7Z5T8_CONA1|nr:uncharacterized protein W97_08805 [Coniosporium apollinis CBS 100218]EON69545.1 hypothetical protein W97_08805 [Coniosporium apollinis CBS 100218]
MAEHTDPPLEPTGPYFQSSGPDYQNGTLGGRYEHDFDYPTSLEPTANMYADAAYELRQLNAQVDCSAEGGSDHIGEPIQAASNADGHLRGEEHIQEISADIWTASRGKSRAVRPRESKRKRTQAADHNEEDHDDPQDAITPRSKRPTKRTTRSAAAKSTVNTSATTTPPQVQPNYHSIPTTFPQHLANAVHTGKISAASAIALYRPENKDLKTRCTRLPMAKLFGAFQVPPEEFLELHAAAKQYMLDPAFPERRDCIGERAKGEMQVGKVKLANYVKDFLEKDGIGERFFGENAAVATPDTARQGAEGGGEDGGASGSQQRKIWPRDAKDIITMLTPLLRRMVTNERQRLYALEQRVARNKDPASNTGVGQQDQDEPPEDVDPTTITPIPAEQVVAKDPQRAYRPSAENVLYILITKRNFKLLPRIDIPAQQSYHPISFQALYELIENQVRIALSYPSERSRSSSAHSVPTMPNRSEQLTSNSNPQSGLEQPNTPVAEPLMPHTPNSYLTEQPQTQPLPSPKFEIRAHTPHGLVPVRSAQAWEEVKVEAAQAIWMEGTLRVIVRVE